ncbi:MAG: ion transporter [Chloroflexales bacterium]|nr:ion transporter [Chloroflexales bacterium]
MAIREYPEHEPELHAARWELLEQVNQLTERPMIALSFVWLGLLIIDFTAGLSPLLQVVSDVIWALFVLDFLIELVIAPRKLAYLRRNWLAALSLALPALRGLRLLPALRLVKAARAARGLRLFRLITSLNRGMRALGKTLSRRGAGYLIALTGVVTTVGAAGMAVFESPAAVAAELGGAVETGAGLASYGEALWWTAMIMTTMGSEYWPRTPEGRILGWLLSLYAFAVFGYITAMIASFFVGQDRGEHDQTMPSDEIAALRDEIAALREELAAREHGSNR